MKILLAEDDLVTREVVKRMLLRIADVVLEAGDGLEALEIIEREDPDFLFTDVDMPQMDGYELIRALRGSHRWAKMPVVCFSAVRDREEVVRLLELGVVDYLLKPIRAQSAEDRCRAIIAQHRDWRRPPRVGGRRVLLLVEPDPNYRAFAKTLLESDFSVIESSSGADAARKYNAAEVKPVAVLIAAQLPLLTDIQLSQMLKKFASDANIAAPTIILVSEADASEEHTAFFDGVMRRTFIPGDFRLEIRRLLEGRETPFEKLAAHLNHEGESWFSSGVRQTLGVTTGSDASSLAAPPADLWTSGLSASIELSAPSIGGKLVVQISADRADAKRMAAALLRRDGLTEAEPGEAFAELINVIGGRVRASLEQHGWDLKLGLPLVNESHSPSDEHWNCESWFGTTDGDTFHVGLRLVAPDGPDAPALAGANAEPAPDGGVEAPLSTVPETDAALL